MLSTNLFAKNLLSKTTPIDGSVIITDSQTQGKGQGQNQWLTESHKNLTFSIIYNTSFLAAQNQFYLSAAIAVGIRKALCEIIDNNEVKIKWPNDLFFNEKKLGGILIENSVLGSYLKNSVIGVGINVNQQRFENLPLATSLFNQGFKNITREKLLSEICAHIECQFLKLKAGQLESILLDYDTHLFRKHEKIRFLKNGREMVGTVSGVNAFGQLMIATNANKMVFNFGGIKWLLP